MLPSPEESLPSSPENSDCVSPELENVAVPSVETGVTEPSSQGKAYPQ